MFLISLVMMLTGISQAAKLDKEMACYLAMNETTREANVVMDGNEIIHPIDGKSFYILSAGSVQKCRVPKNAQTFAGAPQETGPWLFKMKASGPTNHFQYPEAEEHKDIKGAPGWTVPKCTPQSDRKTLSEILENRISDSRQICVEGPKFGDCLAKFLDRLKTCENVPAVKTYAVEIGRAAAAHATPEAPDSGIHPHGGVDPAGSGK